MAVIVLRVGVGAGAGPMSAFIWASIASDCSRFVGGLRFKILEPVAIDSACAARCSALLIDILDLFRVVMEWSTTIQTKGFK